VPLNNKPYEKGGLGMFFRNMKRDKLSQVLTVLILLFIFNAFTIYLKPYVINNLGLTYKEAGLVVIACYSSFVYGLITMFVTQSLETKIKK